MKTTNRSARVLKSEIKWSKREIERLANYMGSYHCRALNNRSEIEAELAIARRTLAKNEAELEFLKNEELKYEPVFWETKRVVVTSSFNNARVQSCNAVHVYDENGILIEYKEIPYAGMFPAKSNVRKLRSVADEMLSKYAPIFLVDNAGIYEGEEI